MKEQLAPTAIIAPNARGFSPNCIAVWIAIGSTNTAAAWFDIGCVRIIVNVKKAVSSHTGLVRPCVSETIWPAR